MDLAIAIIDNLHNQDLNLNRQVNHVPTDSCALLDGLRYYIVFNISLSKVYIIISNSSATAQNQLSRQTTTKHLVGRLIENIKDLGLWRNLTLLYQNYHPFCQI